MMRVTRGKGRALAPVSFLAAGGLSALALVTALISQYGLGTYPCDLCILQRYPYALVIALAASGLALRYRALQRIVLALIVLSLLGNAGIAGYHVAVEQGWADAPTSCALGSGSSQTALKAELKAEILAAPLVSCTDVGASLWGVSMAMWNALYALISAGLTAMLGCNARIFVSNPEPGAKP